MSFLSFQEREVDLLAKEFELAKERQAEFLGDRYIKIYFLALNTRIYMHMLCNLQNNIWTLYNTCMYM